MHVLAEFLHTGLVNDRPDADPNSMAGQFPLWQVPAMAIPTKSNAYAYLNLFGPQTEVENQMLEGREDRLEVFAKQFEAIIVAGIDAAKQEGGELGRASGVLTKTLDRVRVR